MVHVGLNELEGLSLDHLGDLRVEAILDLLHGIPADALSLRSVVPCLFQEGLDFGKSLDALPHPQAEIAKPLMIKSNGPVLA